MNKRSTWSAKLPLILGLCGLLFLVGGFGSWSVGTSIAGAIIATGRLEVERNRQVVQHLEGGIVSAILVQEGDTVTQGEVLIRLDSSELLSQLTITEGQLFELMARRGRLEAERDGAFEIIFDPEPERLAQKNPEIRDLLDGQTRLFRARRATIAREKDQLSKRKLQIQDQIEGLKAQQDSIIIQLELIEKELGGQLKLLELGLAQAGTVLNLRRTLASLEGRLGELTASEAQARGRITELEIEEIKLDTSMREEAITTLRDLRYRELELTESRRAIKKRLERLEIPAPVSGVVYGMQVHALRSVVQAAEPILYLVPQDRPLVIAAQVAPTDVDQISVGQEVSLRFSALDQRQTPELFGSVSQVSADTFDDSNTAMSYYRVEVELNPGEQTRLPEGTVLVPGMPVESYIRTADRSPLQFLVKPLSDYFFRAFRET